MIKKLVQPNTDRGGVAMTLTTANHFAGNIITPRQGYREMGVPELKEYETEIHNSIR